MANVDGWQGRYFEDFSIGDVYRHPLGRTITEADNSWFTLITMNSNQTHFNDHYAAFSEFGRPLVNSGLTLALVLGLSVSDISQNAIANLGWDSIRLTHPLFVGDTVYAESIVTARRPSKSREHAGIVSCLTRGLNQDGDVCITFTRTVMVYKRSAPHDKGHFPESGMPIEALAQSLGVLGSPAPATSP